MERNGKEVFRIYEDNCLDSDDEAKILDSFETEDFDIELGDDEQYQGVGFLRNRLAASAEYLAGFNPILWIDSETFWLCWKGEIKKPTEPMTLMEYCKNGTLFVAKIMGTYNNENTLMVHTLF